MCKNKGQRSFFRTYCSQNQDFEITDDHSFTSDLESSFFHYFNFGYRKNFLDNCVEDYVDTYDFSKKSVNIIEKCIDVSFCSETGTYRSKNDFGDVSPSTNDNSSKLSIVPYSPPKLSIVPFSPPPIRDFSDLWVQCEECDAPNYRKYFFETRLYVCEFCDAHVKLPSSLRIKLLIDTGTWLPLDNLNKDTVSKPALDPWTWDGMWDEDEDFPVEGNPLGNNEDEDFPVEGNPLGNNEGEDFPVEGNPLGNNENEDFPVEGNPLGPQKEKEEHTRLKNPNSYKDNIDNNFHIQNGGFTYEKEETNRDADKEKTTIKEIKKFPFGPGSSDNGSHNRSIPLWIPDTDRSWKNIHNSPGSEDYSDSNKPLFEEPIGDNLGSDKSNGDVSGYLGGNGFPVSENPMENGSGDLVPGLDSGNGSAIRNLDNTADPRHINEYPKPGLDSGNGSAPRDLDSTNVDPELGNGSALRDHYSANVDPGHSNGSSPRDLGNSVDTGNALPARDPDSSNVGPGLGPEDNNAHRDGQEAQSNLESEGYADLPFPNLFGEDCLFSYIEDCPSENNESSRRATRLHIGCRRCLDRTLGSESRLRKDKDIHDSDSESESESRLRKDKDIHDSDSDSESEFDSFISIPFFIKNRELDLDSPCIPLIPTFNKTEKRNTDTRKGEENRKGEDEWKEEWYSDKVKVASHHVNWWRQCKEEGREEGSDWYSDKVKDACQQLAEVDWWRHWNQEDWDNQKELLAGIEFVVEIEEEVEEKPYVTRTLSDQDETGLSEAIQTGLGQLNGIPVALGVMDFEFIGGSMGHVVGDRITRLIEYAGRLGLPLIIVCASGGARMYEGSLSLMQMAKISSALYYFRKNNKNAFYISMLASPTTGGVTASFGMLGDIIISEPDAYIAFAGKRVIEETLKIPVPEGSQVAEVAFEKGLLDPIIPREMLKSVLSELLQLNNFLPFSPKIKGLLS